MVTPEQTLYKLILYYLNSDSNIFQGPWIFYAFAINVNTFSPTHMHPWLLKKIFLEPLPQKNDNLKMEMDIPYGDGIVWQKNGKY